MADALANEQIEPPTPEPTSRLLADSAAYSPAQGFVDEVFAAPGSARDHATGLVSTLDRMGRLVLMDLGRRRDETFRQQGITFAISDPSGAAQTGRSRSTSFPGSSRRTSGMRSSAA